MADVPEPNHPVLSGPETHASKSSIVDVVTSENSKRGKRKKRSEKDGATSGTSSLKAKSSKRNINNNPVWTLQDKQKFVYGLSNKCGTFKKKTDGTVNWQVLTKYIGTKSLKEVQTFARYYNSLESGKIHEEFENKAAIDVWRNLADNLVMPGDNIANICIPQVLTVAALEPVENNDNNINQPNFCNIYNYLSSITRGTEAPELPANDAAVLLDLLEDLIKWLSESHSLVQREYMHNQFVKLREQQSETITMDGHNEVQFNTSTNPFAIPFDILEFKGAELSEQ